MGEDVQDMFCLEVRACAVLGSVYHVEAVHVNAVARGNLVEVAERDVAGENGLRRRGVCVCVGRVQRVMYVCACVRACVCVCALV